MVRKGLILILMVACNFACAKDLGKYGHSFEIEEPDMLSVIESKLKAHQESGVLETVQDNHRERVKRQIKRPNKVAGITKATKNSVRSFDPTIELEEDIVGPENKVLYVKGTKINPLDYQAFDESMLFIDGDDQAQLDFANGYRHPNTIIFVNGEPGLKEINGEERFYYFDQWGALSHRFGIKEVPSVISQAPEQKTLTIEEIYLEEANA